MRIIQPGKPQAEFKVRYRGTCHKCGCVIEPNKHDGPPCPPRPGESLLTGHCAQSVKCPTENCTASIRCEPEQIKEGIEAIHEELQHALKKWTECFWFRRRYWRGKCDGFLLAMKILSEPSTASQDKLDEIVDSLPTGQRGSEYQ